MRAYALLIAAAVLTAFAAGTLALTAARGLEPIDAASANVQLSRARFEASSARELTLELASLFPRIEGAVLLDAEAALPQSHRFEREQLSALVRYAETCAGPAAVTDARLQKALAWHRFLCGEAPLPSGFVETPPFMHPGGQSFAALGADRFGAEWAREHQRFLHATEWRWGVNPPRELLASLEPAALAGVAAGDPLVLDARHVLFAHGEDRPMYAVYPRRAWDAFIAEAPLAPRPYRDRDACVVREGHACWARNEAPFFARLGRMTLALLAASLGSAVVAAGLLVRRVRAQRAAEERQRFVLQTLTHELRTPVASLLVSVEGLRSDLEALSPQAQDHVLRVVDDAQRLRRLTEKSRAYLALPDSGKLLHLEPVRVESIGAWVREVVGAAAQVEVLQDGPAMVDTYWLGTCVRNLVENAVKHGAPPVVVHVRRARWLSIEVRDAGTVGRSATPGLGLGLSIVRRTAEAMGGALLELHTPTRFTLEVPA